MKKKLFLILVTILALPCVTLAQAPGKHIEDREQLWLGYFNQTRLSNKFGLWADIHYRRTENFTDRSFQFLVRPAITYFVKDNLRI
ncbi:MAG TPA: DUF2490 domain-containing protein, partial [Chryseosolibacter sp.]